MSIADQQAQNGMHITIKDNTDTIIPIAQKEVNKMETKLNKSLN
jgi:hypothetical protein